MLPDHAAGRIVGHAHDRRYFSGDQYSRGDRGVELSRAVGAGHGTPRRAHQRAGIFHYGEWHIPD